MTTSFKNKLKSFLFHAAVTVIQLDDVTNTADLWVWRQALCQSWSRRCAVDTAEDEDPATHGDNETTSTTSTDTQTDMTAHI